MSDVKLTYQSLKTVPNQKAYRVNKKREAKDKEDVRVSDIFKNDVLLASRELKDTTFKVYMYFIMNQEGFIGGLSRQDVINKTGVSESSYKRAIKELEDKGYFVYTNEKASGQDGNLPLYNFFALPVGSN